MRRTTSKRSSKTTNKKVRYIFKMKSNVLMEDIHEHSKVNIIFDKDEPFFKYEFRDKEK